MKLEIIAVTGAGARSLLVMRAAEITHDTDSHPREYRETDPCENPDTQYYSHQVLKQHKLLPGYCGDMTAPQSYYDISGRVKP
jgi:hypothetical protein